MLLCLSSPSSLTEFSPMFSLFTRTQSLLFFYSKTNSTSANRSFRPVHAANQCSKLFYLNRTCRLCTASVSASASSPSSKRAKKRARQESPEGVLKHKLGMCSSHGDVAEALRLYDAARRDNVSLTVQHYNVLLYLCSSSIDGDGKGGNSGFSGLDRGFEIFKQMVAEKVTPNEATFTNAARLASAKEDPDMAFDLVEQMKSCGIPPRLRSYAPALFGFCKKKMGNKAYEVDAHMIESGISAEEPELAALLKLSSEVGREDKVYEMMHRLRATVRQISEETAYIVEEWFKSETATEVGVENWDPKKVKKGVTKGGGGWHGQGWLGRGKWNVVRTEVDGKGVCRSCGDKLVCIDIDPKETKNFATSLTTLACEREVRNDFLNFHDWLQRHGPFDAVIDGANVGLVKQDTFSFFQLKSAVNKLREVSPSKRLPLVILHKNRVTSGPAQHPNNKRILENWQKSGVLYPTPHGSNDDWYWLYAAVRCNCLLVTNDEMRDHLFQLLGNSFFPRWKEKHQVRLSVTRENGLNYHMPPPYSIVIQESEKGHWHMPTVTGDDLEIPRQWVCATRLGG